LSNRRSRVSLVWYGLCAAAGNSHSHQAGLEPAKLCTTTITSRKTLLTAEHMHLKSIRMAKDMPGAVFK